MVHDVRVRGEEPEVHRDAEVDEEEEARGDEVRTCEHREQAEGEPQRQPSRQWREEQLAPVGRGEGGRGDDDVQARVVAPPHGVAQRNVRTDPVDHGAHAGGAIDRRTVDGDDPVVEREPAAFRADAKR